jgi:REP element-mobilizing transposase RayT
MPHHPERKSPRLPGYDYSLPGAYFITACTKNREFVFASEDARLAVVSAWHSVLEIFANIMLGEFVVMPNHVHGIIWILAQGAYRLHPGKWKNDNSRRAGQLPGPTGIVEYESLSNIMGAFKTTAASRVNKLRGVVGVPVWQRSFYDRIVRNDHELERIQHYIRMNPVKWGEDRDNLIGAKFQSPAKSIDDYWVEIFDEMPFLT